jgi:hypothetical protein
MSVCANGSLCSKVCVPIDGETLNDIDDLDKENKCSDSNAAAVDAPLSPLPSSLAASKFSPLSPVLNKNNHQSLADFGSPSLSPPPAALIRRPITTAVAPTPASRPLPLHQTLQRSTLPASSSSSSLSSSPLIALEDEFRPIDPSLRSHSNMTENYTSPLMAIPMDHAIVTAATPVRLSPSSISPPYVHTSQSTSSFITLPRSLTSSSSSLISK